MPFWEGLLTGGIKGMAEGVGSLVKDLRVAITGDEPLTAVQKAALQEQLLAMEAVAQKAAADFDTAQMTGQIELNKIEAGSDSLYKSGWRPAAGWVCIAGLAYTFVVKPLLPWTVQVVGIPFGYVSALPPMVDIPMGDLLALLAGLLGLGTMRMVEKIKGVAR
ncbi:MAG: 3TM-type holin [Desulfuromonadaceae bacterium]